MATPTVAAAYKVARTGANRRSVGTTKDSINMLGQYISGDFTTSNIAAKRCTCLNNGGNAQQQRAAMSPATRRRPSPYYCSSAATNNRLRSPYSSAYCYQQPLILPVTRNAGCRSFLSTSSANDDDDAGAAHSFPLTTKRSSGRSVKRTQRRLRWKQDRIRNATAMSNSIKEGETTVGQELQDNAEKEEVDTRTWRTILFPTIDDDDSSTEPPIQWPKSPLAWYKVLREAGGIYKDNWDYSKAKGADDAKKDGENSNDNNEQAAEESAAKQIADNASKNLEVAREEGGRLLQEAQARTGIYTLDDVKAVAREMMKVATAMLSEFIQEYRKGRDDEVDKMLNEYFQEEAKKDNEDDTKEEDDSVVSRPKRRPRKRRIPTRVG